QVELMAVRVAENLGRMEAAVRDGDDSAGRLALAAHAEIAPMLVSLPGRCYDLLARESPVAGDLRFIVSVLRVLEELERIGDLALRVVKQVSDRDLLASQSLVHTRLIAMAELAVQLHGLASRAWSSQ